MGLQLLLFYFLLFRWFGQFSFHTQQFLKKKWTPTSLIVLANAAGLLSWVHEPRIEGGQKMTYGRSLERHLKYFGLVDDGGKVISFSEWATAAPVRHQGHARGEAEVFLARRAQETKQRRALFNAETDAEEI